MKPSEDLFHLIKSLTKSEKRYFKRFCMLYTTEKKNNYLKLFDAIDKQKVYDENKLKNKFKSETFVKQLSVVKDYLSKLILRSLITVESKRNLYYELRQSVAECELLMLRGLYKQSYKKSRVIKKLSYKYGYFVLILELLGNEKVLVRELNSKKQNEELKEIISEEELILNEIIKIRQILNLNRELMSLLNKIGVPVRSESDIMRIHAISDKFSNISICKTSSYQSKTIYYHSKTMIHMAINEYNYAYKYSIELYETLRKYEYLSSKDPRNFYGVLHNLVLISLHIKNYAGAEKYSKEISKFLDCALKFSTAQTRNNINLNYFVLQLTFNNKLCRIEENLQLIAQSKEYVKKHEHSISAPETGDLFCEIIQTYMLNNDWENALHYTNLLLNNTDNKMKSDMKLIINIYNILIHYELNNVLYLDNIVSSFYRYLYRSGKEYPLELLVITYLKKLLHAKNKPDFLEILKLLRQKLLSNGNTSYEKHIIENYYILEWIESKIEEKSLKEIVLRRFM